MNDWVPEERPVPEELTDEFDHEVYPPAATKFADWVTQLESATADVLHLYVAGGTGTLNYRQTEIGGE